jgi:hypothetical protein
MQRNPDRFWPIWYAYYLRAFSPCDVYVLDNDSDPPIPDGIPIHSKYAYDDVWMNRTIVDFLKALLALYDAVVYVECDEFLVPQRGTLKDYLETVDGPRTVVGYNLVCGKKDEPIDWDKPIIRQRPRWQKRCDFYKPSITQTAQEYVRQFKDAICSDLWLVHINRIDYDYSWKITQEHGAMNWSPRNLQNHNGWQHRIREKRQFDNWFWMPQQPASAVQPVPQDIVDAL